MPCSQTQLWWFFRLTTFFFFGGLGCFIPHVTPHLKWLGFNLREISAIHLISGVFSALGLVLAAASTSHRGHRICLLVSLLLAAFSSAALIFIPRLEGRVLESEGRPPIAEILCSEDGSVLLFNQCGSSCDLDGSGRLGLQISDCKFEPKTQLSANWNELTEQFNFLAANPDPEDESSEPERGDLPEKTVPDERDSHQRVQQEVTEEQGKIQQGPNSNIDSDQYDYDYEANHNQVKDEKPVATKSVQSVPSQQTDEYDYDSNVQDVDESRKKREAQILNQEDFNDWETEEDEVPSHFQPHLCYETGPQSKICHAFSNADHTLHLESVFRKGISRGPHCFYPLIHSDNENQLLSEVQCRSHSSDLQVRCRVDGIELRSRVAENGSDICQDSNGNYHLAFWLYLLFRTLAEIGVVATLILIFMVSLDCEQRQLQGPAVSQKPKTFFLNCWWLWAALGAGIHGPVSGFLYYSGVITTPFILGAAAFGLAAVTVIFVPHQREEDDQESCPDQFQNDQPFSVQHFWICRRTMGKILGNRKSFWILALMILFGTGVAVVHTSFYWYLTALGSSYLLYGISMTTAVILSGAIFPAKTWLFAKCGHNYIFMIGLLLYSIRFFGYALIRWPLILIILEPLEVFCSCWMLITAAIAICTLVSKQKVISRLKVNVWALIIVFHYSIGRGLGSLYVGLSSYYFGVRNVFVGTAIIFVLGTGLWLLLYLTVAKSQRKYQMNKDDGKTKKTNGSNKQDKQHIEPMYAQLESQESTKKNLKN